MKMTNEQFAVAKQTLRKQTEHVINKLSTDLAPGNLPTESEHPRGREFASLIRSFVGGRLIIVQVPYLCGPPAPHIVNDTPYGSFDSLRWITTDEIDEQIIAGSAIETPYIPMSEFSDRMVDLWHHLQVHMRQALPLLDYESLYAQLPTKAAPATA